MRLLSRFFMAVGFSLLAASASATPDNPQNGKDYLTLEKPQQTESAGKVEVTEFFWYSCPHCSALDPALADWVKKQGDKISFKRVPVAFRDSFVPQQRLYYSLEAMGKADELQAKIFRAIHVERRQLDTEAQIVEFIAKEGVDKQKFLDLYNSFGVDAKVKRAVQLQSAYQIQGVPTLAVDGRYLTAPSIVSEGNGRMPEPALHAATLKVMDKLVTMSAKPAAKK
ncbi:thiol:disulfide interchange protein DsbA/DsbL [Noviherbaspirillum sedimenti]|uniref:Thiol:disulfide interchange protein n=1 Tax=Noviherbaspirillum sedimenti TaxID=2320865 RepID=A0A3A3G6Z3_9BURK|nr:thiol:disulfide interchange protein DsbA/DsbL [Noviherbaspirillum sedimenti]RJG02509.1 thiol:disulfide interchange protein DsbA/DsbL [Noviherbaspirillum sedimenti]